MGSTNSRSHCYCFCCAAPESPPRYHRLRSHSDIKPSWAVQDFSKYTKKTCRHYIKDSLQCKFESIGSLVGCRCEDYLQQKGSGAFTGLHCNWVTPHILASARPSDQLIDEHQIISQFKRSRIGSIFNLQEPGEHAMCGSGLKLNSGFSYTPETFMKNNRREGGCSLPLQLSMEGHAVPQLGIYARHYASHGIPNFTRREGRTGLVIACYFVYTNQFQHSKAIWVGDGWQAVQGVRDCRPGALQTNHQVEHVKTFESYLKDLRVIFGYPERFFQTGQDLHGFMVRQRKFLHGQEARDLHCIPKIVFWITKDLIKRTNLEREKREKIADAFMTELASDFETSRDSQFLKLVEETKQRVNAGIWDDVENLDVQVLVHLLVVWIRLLQKPILPDGVLSLALGRGEIEGAIRELNNCDKSSLATIQILACWMFEIVPVKPSLIRCLYSGLAHVLLHRSSLEDVKEKAFSNPGFLKPGSSTPHDSQNESPSFKRRSMVRGTESPYSKYRPSHLENEFGLLLEAAARYWVKESKAARARVHESILHNSTEAPLDYVTKEKKLRGPLTEILAEEPWMQERASLQF